MKKIRTFLKKNQNISIKARNFEKVKLHRAIEDEETLERDRKKYQQELNDIITQETHSREWDTKIKFHVHRESPSRLLTSILKNKRKEANVFNIKDKEGEIISDIEGICKCFRDFYQDQYQEKKDDPTEHMKLLKKWNINRYLIKSLKLDDDITEEEVSTAIKYSSGNKAPGPDGINAQLYKNHAEKLVPILTKVFNHNFKKEIPLPEEFKNGIITTLFKKGDELLISNRRPITLLNTDYKIYSKILNNRLLKITGKIINQYQNGFVPGRFIQDNIQIMKEIIEISNNRKQTCFITFFDFNKAFDSISHNSIYRTLQHIGLPKMLTTAIMNLLIGSKNKIKVNGSLTKSIDINRGTKQGDPISPTLFALVLEPLLADILKDKAIKGVELPEILKPEEKEDKISIKLTAFADDIATFNHTIEELKIVVDKIDKYCKATTSLLNADKTIMITTGTDKQYNTPFSVSEAPERYLGLNFTGKGLDSKINGIINEIKESLSNWRRESFTLRCKMSVLKSYALSKLTYHCYIDSLTQTHIDTLNNLARWFLFSALKDNYRMEKKYRTLMTTDRAYAEWTDGGIKLWDLGLRQKAMKIWSMNRLMCKRMDDNLNGVHIWYIRQIIAKKYISNDLKDLAKAWEDYRIECEKSFIKITQAVDGIRNVWRKPIKLKDIYSDLIKKKYPTGPRRTEGQRMIGTFFINQTFIFEKVAKIIHQRGRNTLFRFFARILPGINYMRKDPCKICNVQMLDPYIHLFTECSWIKNIDKSISSTINSLSYVKIKKWDINALDLNIINSTYKVHPNLIAIVVHEIWIIICHKLFNDDITKPLPTFSPESIENKLNQLISVEKWILHKKIEQDETIKKELNDVILKADFIKQWQTPKVPNPFQE